MDNKKQKTKKNHQDARKKTPLWVVFSCFIVVFSSFSFLQFFTVGTSPFLQNGVVFAAQDTPTAAAEASATQTAVPFLSIEGHIFEYQEPKPDDPTPTNGGDADTRGNPAYGAMITLFQDVNAIVTTSTNHFGYFRFGVLLDPSVEYSLLITKDRFASVKATLPSGLTKSFAEFIISPGPSSTEEDQSDKIVPISEANFTVPTPDYRKIDTLFPATLNVEDSSFGRYLGFLLTWLYSMSAGVGVISIMMSGYGYMTAAGNPTLLNNAKRKLTTSIVALTLIFSAWLLTSLIGGFSIMEWGI